MTQLNLNALRAAAAETGVDQSRISSGGEIPAEGPCDLRFVGYIELGKHEKTFKGVKKVTNKAVLVFELVSPQHIRKNDEGKVIPTLIRQTVNLSQSQRATWPKLFAQLNYNGTGTHATDFLGNAYLGTVHHREYVSGGETRKTADLNAKDMPVLLTAPREFDRKTGQYVPVDVAQPNAALHALLWNNPSADQWASIYIEGAFEEEKDAAGKVTKPGRSKNRYQEEALRAINFEGSPLKTLLVQAGANVTPAAYEIEEEVEEALPTPAYVPTAGAQNDPLSGVSLS